MLAIDSLFQSARFEINLIYLDEEANCGKGLKWYGWNPAESVGSISTVLSCGGYGRLDFGNCWNDGVVVAYLNDKVLQKAYPNTPSQPTFWFYFKHGDRLALYDEGDGSIIQFNQFYYYPGKGAPSVA